MIENKQLTISDRGREDTLYLGWFILKRHTGRSAHMSNPTPDVMLQCLILACGNTLRGDDGVGPQLASWVEERFAGDLRVRVIARQQWTPELVQDISESESVIFVDCAVDAAPGEVKVAEVEPAKASGSGLATHHIGAAELLALSKALYGAMPRTSLLLTVGAGSTELGESLSELVRAALPRAQHILEETILRLLDEAVEPAR
jgi:hydrogenase maturation protease